MLCDGGDVIGGEGRRWNWRSPLRNRRSEGRGGIARLCRRSAGAGREGRASELAREVLSSKMAGSPRRGKPGEGIDLLPARNAQHSLG